MYPPISSRPLEEILLSRLQSSSLISTYTASQPPLELLDFERIRFEQRLEFDDNNNDDGGGGGGGGKNNNKGGVGVKSRTKKYTYQGVGRRELDGVADGVRDYTLGRGGSSDDNGVGGDREFIKAVGNDRGGFSSSSSSSMMKRSGNDKGSREGRGLLSSSMQALHSLTQTQSNDNTFTSSMRPNTTGGSANSSGHFDYTFGFTNHDDNDDNEHDDDVDFENANNNNTNNNHRHDRRQGQGQGQRRQSESEIIANLTSQINVLSTRLIAMEDRIRFDQSISSNNYGNGNGGSSMRRLNKPHSQTHSQTHPHSHSHSRSQSIKLKPSNSTLRASTSSSPSRTSPSNHHPHPHTRTRTRTAPSRTNTLTRRRSSSSVLPTDSSSPTANANADDAIDLIDIDRYHPTHPKLAPLIKSSGVLVGLISEFDFIYESDSIPSSSSTTTTGTGTGTGMDKSSVAMLESTTSLTSKALIKHSLDVTRLNEYDTAKRSWISLHCSSYIDVLSDTIANITSVNNVVDRMMYKVNMNYTKQLITHWRHLTSVAATIRMNREPELRRTNERRVLAVMKAVYNKWQVNATGRYSRRNVVKRYRVRMDNARTELTSERERGYQSGNSSNGSNGSVGLGLITNETLHLRQSKTGVIDMHNIRIKRIKQTTFNTFKAIHATLTNKRFLATRHHHSKILGLIVKVWKEYAYVTALGLNYTIRSNPLSNQSPSSRSLSIRSEVRYSVRYSDTKVTQFSRRRVLKKVIKLWRPVCTMLRKSRVMRTLHFTAYTLKHLRAWRTVIKKRVSLKRAAINEWLGYSKRLVMTPFRLWYIYIDQRRRTRQSNEALLRSYLRSKLRKFMYAIIKGWRHQSVYGRIAGLYSRNELMKSLTEEQKNSENLGIKMEGYVRNVKVMNGMLEDNTVLIGRMEEEGKVKEGKNKDLRMAMHHAEQEIVKMQSLITCVRDAFPSVTKHILELQPAFDFNFRGLHVLSELRRIEEKATGVETELGTVNNNEFNNALLYESEETTLLNLSIQNEKLEEERLASVLAVELTKVLPGEVRVGWCLDQADFRRVGKIGGVDVRLLSEVDDDDGDDGDSAIEETDYEKATQSLIDTKDNNDKLVANKQVTAQQIKIQTQALTDRTSEHVDKIWSIQSLCKEVVRLHGLFEFMRSGDVSALSFGDGEVWECEGGGRVAVEVLERVREDRRVEDENAAADAAKAEEEEEERRRSAKNGTSKSPRNSGGNSMSSSRSRSPSPKRTSRALQGSCESYQLSSDLGDFSEADEHRDVDEDSDDNNSQRSTQNPPTDKYKSITKPNVTGRPYVWQDFLTSLALRIPEGRPTEVVGDGVMRRIGEMRLRGELMLGRVVDVDDVDDDGDGENEEEGEQEGEIVEDGNISTANSNGDSNEDGEIRDDDTKEVNIYTGRDFEDEFDPRGAKVKRETLKLE